MILSKYMAIYVMHIYKRVTVHMRYELAERKYGGDSLELI